MKFFKYVFFLSLLLGGYASAQTTPITAQIIDSDGIAWNGGTWSASLTNVRSGTIKRSNGALVTGTALTMSGVLDGTGTFTGTLLDTTQLVPSGITWVFSICPKASFGCSTTSGITVAGTSLQNLSSAINSQITAPRFPASPSAYGYVDTEISPTPSPGGFYFNTLTLQQRIWNGLVWANSATAGSGTVTSVTVSAPAGIMAASGNPVVNSGTIALSFTAQAAHAVFVGPTAGVSAIPTWRQLVANDIPTITAAQVSGLGVAAYSNSYLDLINRPTIPAAQVQSDWNALSGVSFILNKPTIPPVVSFQVNGVANSNQSILNLAAGTNATLTPGAGGLVTISATGGGGFTLPNAPAAGYTIVSSAAGTNYVVDTAPLGTAAHSATTSFMAAGSGLLPANNLSDLANSTTALTNLQFFNTVTRLNIAANTSGTAAGLSIPLPVSLGGTGLTSVLTGVVKGNGTTYSAALFGDIAALWTDATCATTTNALLMNGTCAAPGGGGGGGFTAGGDLTGTSTVQTVAKVQGEPWSTTAPTTGQAPIWSGSQWAPGATTATVTSQYTYRMVEDGGADATGVNDVGAKLNTLLSFTTQCNNVTPTNCVPSVIYFKPGVYLLTTMVHPTIHASMGNVVFDCQSNGSAYDGGRVIFNVKVPAGQDGIWFDAPAGADLWNGPELRGCQFNDGTVYTMPTSLQNGNGTFSSSLPSNVRSALHYSGVNQLKGTNIGFQHFIGNNHNPNGVNGGAAVTSGVPCKLTINQFVIICTGDTSTAAQAAMYAQGFFWATDVGGTGRGYPQEITEAHVAVGTNWIASHAYFQGDVITDSNGNSEMCLSNPGTSGTVHPTWPTVVNGTVVDNTMTWTRIDTGANTLVIGLSNIYQHASQAAAFNWFINYGGHGMLIDGFGNSRTNNAHTGTYVSFSQYGGMRGIYAYCTLNPFSASGTFYNTYTSGGSISGSFGGAQSPSQYGVSRIRFQDGFLAGACENGNSSQASNGRMTNSIGSYMGVDTDTIDFHVAANFFTANSFQEVTHASIAEGENENTGSGAQPNNLVCTDVLGAGYTNGHCSWGTLMTGDVGGGSHCAYNKITSYAISQGQGIEIGPTCIRTIIEGQQYGATAGQTLNYPGAGHDTVNGTDIQLPVVGDPNCSSFTSCNGLQTTQINGTSGINKWPAVTPLTNGAGCSFRGGTVYGTDGAFYSCTSAGVVFKH